MDKAQFLHEFTTIKAVVSEPETEDNWEKIEKALAKLEAVTKGGAYKLDEYVGAIRAIADPIVASMLSERSRLCGTAVDLIQSVAPRLAHRFESLLPFFVPPLLKLCSRANRVVIKRSERAINIIAQHCHLPAILPYLKEGVKEKSSSARTASVDGLIAAIGAMSKDLVGRRVRDIEDAIRHGATDSNADVRQRTKKLWDAYKGIWPERIDEFTAPLTPTIRRYLSIAKGGGPAPPIAEPLFRAKPSKPHPLSQSASAFPVETPSSTAPVSHRSDDAVSSNSSSAPTSRHVRSISHGARIEQEIAAARKAKEAKPLQELNKNTVRSVGKAARVASAPAKTLSSSKEPGPRLGPPSRLTVKPGGTPASSASGTGTGPAKSTSSVRRPAAALGGLSAAMTEAAMARKRIRTVSTTSTTSTASSASRRTATLAPPVPPVATVKPNTADAKTHATAATKAAVRPAVQPAAKPAARTTASKSGAGAGARAAFVPTRKPAWKSAAGGPGSESSSRAAPAPRARKPPVPPAPGRSKHVPVESSEGGK